MFGHPLVFFDSFQFDSNKKWCFFYVQFIQKQKSNYFITGKKNKKKSMIYIRQEKTTLYVVKRLFFTVAASYSRMLDICAEGFFYSLKIGSLTH